MQYKKVGFHSCGKSFSVNEFSTKTNVFNTKETFLHVRSHLEMVFLLSGNLSKVDKNVLISTFYITTVNYLRLQLSSLSFDVYTFILISAFASDHKYPRRCWIQTNVFTVIFITKYASRYFILRKFNHLTKF